MKWYHSAIAAFVLVAMQAPNSGLAQSIVRIEEDWELHVTEPHQELDAPQVTTTMYPFGELTDLAFQLDINYGQTPSFSSGGYQVRVAEGEETLAARRGHEGLRLSTDSETLTWTQVVHHTPQGVYFGITNGQSASWGSFGGDSSFVYLSNSDAGMSLNSYSHLTSLENSGVAYAGNRVGWLKLNRLRVYNGAGQVAEWIVNQPVQ